MSNLNPTWGKWEYDFVITPTQCNRSRMLYRHLPRREYPPPERYIRNTTYWNKKKTTADYLKKGWTGFKRTYPYPTLRYSYVTDLSRIGLH